MMFAFSWMSLRFTLLLLALSSTFLLFGGCSGQQTEREIERTSEPQCGLHHGHAVSEHTKWIKVGRRMCRRMITPVIKQSDAEPCVV